MAVGQGSRVALGASYFVVVARALHPDGLGAFAGTVALVALAAPFASLGAGNLMIKHVARDPRHFQRYWGGALSTTIISGAVLGILILACARLLLPTTIPFQLIVCVMAADLLFSRILDINGQAYQAHERLSRTAQFPLLISVGALVSGQLGPQRGDFGRGDLVGAGAPGAGDRVPAERAPRRYVLCD
jgi:O-antigen/teichoic acid export membrane protein